MSVLFLFFLATIPFSSRLVTKADCSNPPPSLNPVTMLFSLSTRVTKGADGTRTGCALSTRSLLLFRNVSLKSTMTMTVMETSKWLIFFCLLYQPRFFFFWLMGYGGKLALLRLDMIIMGVLLDHKGQTIIPQHQKVGRKMEGRRWKWKFSHNRG